MTRLINHRKVPCVGIFKLSCHNLEGIVYHEDGWRFFHERTYGEHVVEFRTEHVEAHRIERNHTEKFVIDIYHRKDVSVRACNDGDKLLEWHVGRDALEVCLHD